MRTRKPIPSLVCQCGCGQPIPPKEKHRYHPPKYLYGHMRREVVSERNRKIAEHHRTKPPEGWTPPSGLCECGCGGKTPISLVSHPKRDVYAGYPCHFLRGHGTRGKRGPEAPSWRGGRRVRKDGYVMVYAPDHPDARANGYVMEHRLVYEQSRGIRLPKRVQVHHINGVKGDNRPENLIALSAVEHSTAHRLAREIISLFLDDRLLSAAREHVRRHGDLPDLERLTATAYSPLAG